MQTLPLSNSPALGGALRAANAMEGQSWAAVLARFALPDPNVRLPSAQVASAACDSLRAKFASKVQGLPRH